MSMKFAIRPLAIAAAAAIAVPATLGGFQAAADPIPAKTTQLAQSRLQLTRIPMILVTAIMNSAFRGTRMRLNNYGSSRRPWFLANDSTLTLSSRLGGGTIRFSIPEYRAGATRYYVRDVNLRGVSVTQLNTVIRIGLFYDSRGVELKGHCWGWILKCPAGNDSSRPDVNIDNMRVVIRLLPTALDGSVSYGRVWVRFNGRIQARGVCRLAGDPCNAYLRYKPLIRNAIGIAVRRQLLQIAVRRRVARALRPLLDSRGIGRVVMAYIHRNDLVVVHRPFPRS